MKILKQSLFVVVVLFFITITLKAQTSTNTPPGGGGGSTNDITDPSLAPLIAGDDLVALMFVVPPQVAATPIQVATPSMPPTSPASKPSGPIAPPSAAPASTNSTSPTGVSLPRHRTPDREHFVVEREGCWPPISQLFRQKNNSVCCVWSDSGNWLSTYGSWTEKIGVQIA
jgi:hypothetical protein